MSNAAVTASAAIVVAAAAPPAVAAGSSEQAQAAAFAEDPRVHFDKQSGTWMFEDDDGNEMEYDAAKGAWVPIVSTQASTGRGPLFETEQICGAFVAFRGSAESPTSSVFCPWC